MFYSNLLCVQSKLYNWKFPQLRPACLISKITCLMVSVGSELLTFANMFWIPQCFFIIPSWKCVSTQKQTKLTMLTSAVLTLLHTWMTKNRIFICSSQDHHHLLLPSPELRGPAIPHNADSCGYLPCFIVRLDEDQTCFPLMDRLTPYLDPKLIP